MAKEDLRGTKEQEFFNGFWQIYKEFHKPEDNEAYWKGLVESSSNLVARYEKEDFYKMAVKIMNAALSSLEDKAKGRSGKAVDYWEKQGR